jgi:hypothetical protein
MGRGRVPGQLGATEGAGQIVNHPDPLGTHDHDGSASDLSVTLEEFKAKVLEAQIRNAKAKGRGFCANVPKDQLGLIEGRHRMRKAAAERCKALLAAARAALAEDQSRGESRAVMTKKIGVHSAYRNISEDTLAWNASFRQYYEETREAREALPGGAHGKRAVGVMAKMMISYKAAPGYSNHSNGLAVDFSTTYGTDELKAKKAQRSKWRRTWLHKWLVEHAGDFSFQPLATEEWHWDYSE